LIREVSRLWRFSEFYSSPDRTIQFIEMQEVGGSAIEHNISEHWFKTTGYNQSMTDLLGSDLPPESTANKKLLVGSDSYATLSGLPPPDYTIPDGAIDPAGATVTWWLYQEVVIPPATMPSEGTNSLHVTNPSQFNPPSIWATGPSSPTNFAGQTGSVVLPTAVPRPRRAGWPCSRSPSPRSGSSCSRGGGEPSARRTSRGRPAGARDGRRARARAA
jgi:hypothetical protein